MTKKTLKDLFHLKKLEDAFSRVRKVNIFGKEGGVGIIPKPVRLQGTSVSMLTLGNPTATAKHFENTGIYRSNAEKILKIPKVCKN